MYYYYYIFLLHLCGLFGVCLSLSRTFLPPLSFPFFPYLQLLFFVVLLLFSHLHASLSSLFSLFCRLDSSSYFPRSDFFCDLMSKKMKRVSLESSSYGVFEDSKSRLKRQILFQDYQELHKETDGTRHKLEDSKLRKLRLLAEVRFLRQRRAYLLQLKSLSRPQGQQLVPMPNPETYDKNRSKDKVYSKKKAKLNKLTPLPGPKQNGRIQVASKKTPDIHVRQKHKLGGGKDDVLHNAVFGLNREARVYSEKEVSSGKGAPAYDLKQNERFYIANNADLRRGSKPAFDLNNDTGHSGKEAALPTRAPVFDLNEISTF
ncbi:PREDICTED: uncharacterized protein LOC109226460 isoform X2 [Nicotiana attenuata]|uniref:uncharacterized protein LOC109226460 isoform X2 n=1 Tax=Nicotiana attenuata TaxID=49451 RepID=UPI000904D158|nr:PREDICTED: uncharacterized protein LOC109226460 isoform X2 [Nicotiana attenuata]